MSKLSTFTPKSSPGHVKINIDNTTNTPGYVALGSTSSNLAVSKSDYPDLFTKFGQTKTGAIKTDWRPVPPFNDVSQAYLPTYDVIYANGLFVYGGYKGDLYTSTDGYTLTVRNSAWNVTYVGSRQNTNYCTYQNGEFVCITEKTFDIDRYYDYGYPIKSWGMYSVDSTTDGANWTIGKPFSLNYIGWDESRGIVYGQGVYVIGVETAVFTTTDKNNISFTDLQTSANGVWPRSITYGNGLFLMSGSLAGNTLASSTNGYNWTFQTGPAGLPENSPVCYGNGIFVTANGNDSGNVFTSTNTVNWSSVITSFPMNEAVNALNYVNGIFFFGSLMGTIVTTTDLSNWSVANSNTRFPIKNFEYGNGLYVNTNNCGHIGTSSDGINWVKREGGLRSKIPGPAGQFSLYYGNGIFLKISSNTMWDVNWVNGNNFKSVFATTTNPELANTPIEGNVRSLSYGKGTWVYGSEYGEMGTSTNAINWTPITSPVTGKAETTYGNGVFVVSDGAVFANSTNLSNWNVSASSLFPVSLRSHKPSGSSRVAYGNGIFYTIYRNSKAFTTTNGANWIDVPIAKPGYSISGTVNCYGNGLYVALAANTTVLLNSTNLVNWAAVTSGTSSSINAIIYANGIYLYGTNAGGLSSSTDGTNWTAVTSGTSSNITALTYGNGLYVYGGAGGAAASSTNGANWTARTGTIAISCFGYGNGIFVAGSTSTNIVYSSTNIVNWTTTAVSRNVSDIAYGNGFFIYTSIDTNGGGSFMTSTNGLHVVTNRSPAPFDFHQYQTSIGHAYIAYGNGIFVFSNFSSNNNVTDVHLYTSVNPTLASLNRNYLANVNQIAYGRGRYVYASGLDDNANYLALFASSTDGTNVSYAATGTYPLCNVAYGNGIFYATGLNLLSTYTNRGYTSTNGVNWTLTGGGVSSNPTNIMPSTSKAIYANGEFVFAARSATTITQGAGGNVANHQFITTTNGTNFANPSTPSYIQDTSLLSPREQFSVAYGNSPYGTPRYVMTGRFTGQGFNGSVVSADYNFDDASMFLIPATKVDVKSNYFKTNNEFNTYSDYGVYIKLK